MLGKAQELGCNQSDIACLCNNQNFRYGIRDCTTASCPQDAQSQVIDFGNSICAGAAAGGSGVVTQTVPSGSVTVVVSTGTDSGKYSPEL